MRLLDSWEMDGVEECRRRLAVDPTDETAREVLQDIPAAMQDTSTSFSWFLIEMPHRPVSHEKNMKYVDRVLAQYASRGIYPNGKAIGRKS